MKRILFSIIALCVAGAVFAAVLDHWTIPTITIAGNVADTTAISLCEATRASLWHRSWGGDSLKVTLQGSVDNAHWVDIVAEYKFAVDSTTCTRKVLSDTLKYLPYQRLITRQGGGTTTDTSYIQFGFTHWRD